MIDWGNLHIGRRWEYGQHVHDRQRRRPGRIRGRRRSAAATRGSTTAAGARPAAAAAAAAARRPMMVSLIVFLRDTIIDSLEGEAL